MSRTRPLIRNLARLGLLAALAWPPGHAGAQALPDAVQQALQ